MLLRSFLALSLVVAGCAHSGASGEPDRTLQAYSRALEAGRAQEAYALLSSDAQKSIPFEAFQRMLKENPEEIKELARSLRRPAQPPQVTATVTPPNGPTLLLVYEDGRWRVDASSIDLYSQATPERAVAGFVRAYENRRFDVLMRFVPDAQKKDLTPASLEKAWTSDQKDDVEHMMQALRAALPTARFEVLGERATLAFGASGMLELVREHGTWKVEDLK
ncbi:MAG TPA: hypothetical protein VFQ35_28260 [Polyangiaceae bacterium]|nr:hypothetical protein [Polyangiaceae bacterium]